MAPDTLPAEPVADDIDDTAILPLGDTEAIKITGKVRVALELMAFDGLAAKDAADRSGLKRNSLYGMLGMPRYAQALKAMLQVRRSSARARNIAVLEDIRDNSHSEGARVKAIQVLEALDAKAPQVTVNINPGWVIDMSSVAPGRMIEHHPGNGSNPLIEHEVVPADARGTRRDEADDG